MLTIKSSHSGVLRRKIPPGSTFFFDLTEVKGLVSGPL